MHEKKKKVPQLRFPGFSEEWEERKLGEVYTQRNERGFDSLKILSVSIHHGVSNEELDSDTLGKKVRRSEDKSLYKHVYVGDLVLNMMRAWQGAIGVVQTEGMVSPAYITAIPSAQLYPPFMDYCLRRDETIGQIDNLSYGVTDFRKRLYWNSFIDVSCCIPSVPEQEKITAFFKRLDNLITLHQRQLTHLQDRKKGLLQKMFPKDGELFPELRYPGFTDDWEVRKLGEYTKLITKGTTPKDKTGNGSINFVKVENISNGKIKPVTKISEEEHEKYLKRSKLQENDILFSIAGTLGRIAVVDISVLPANTNQALSIIRGYDFDTNFLITSLAGKAVTEFIRKNPTVGAQPNLSLEQVGELSIWTPRIQEQAKIGAFFKQLDDSITLHQRKLNHLQNRKKALLQKMFV